MGIKRWLALIGAIIIAAPNAFLTAICFYALIGNLSYVFGLEFNHGATLLIASALGIGLTVGEGLTHMDTKDKGFNLTRFVALLLMAATNIFAGNYRVAESGRLARMEARQQAQNDPRWQDLEKAQASYEAMNHNRYAGDDSLASAGIARIARERNALTQEYVGDASVNNDSVQIMGIGTNSMLNVLWLAINILFGICVRIAYNGNHEKEETKPIHYPGFWLKRTPISPESLMQSRVVTAKGETIEEPKPRSPGFHASWREEYADTAPIPKTPELGRVELPETREVIRYVEVPVKETEVVKEKPDMAAKAARSRALRTGKKNARIAQAKELKAQGLTTAQIARKMGVSDSSVRGWLKQ